MLCQQQSFRNVCNETYFQTHESAILVNPLVLEGGRVFIGRGNNF